MTLSIPGYHVGELLGHGSHGEVWSAMSRRTGEHVAIKRVALESPDAVAAIRGEAGLLAALSHPNIIALREFLEAADSAVLVMELAAGGSLTDLLARRGTLTPAEVGVCFSDLAAALAHAHDEGVLHGDLSASNVLFTADGRAKLADLGLARVFCQSSSGIGTPTYLDPVVAAGGPAGAASDVFSLAAVALHALTGAGPWAAAGDSAEAVLAVAAEADISDLDARLASCSSELSAALIRALDPEPGRRGTAAELALDLRAAVVPAAVTLQAGRLSSAAGRHYAPPRRDAKASEGLGVLDRPDFSRPETAGGPSADLTHARRSDVRALLAPASRPRGRLRELAGRRGVQAAAVLALVVAGSVAVLTRLEGPGAAAALPAPAVSGGGVSTESESRSPDPSPTPALTQTPPSAGASRSALTPTADAVVDELRVLDSLRSNAFATGRADLLAGVYDSPVLLAQDGAQLRRVVGAGCTLTPLSTDYRDVVVSPHGDDGGVDLTAMVSTSAAQLSCRGRVTAHVDATPPSAMTITLTRTPDGSYRIASQGRASPSPG